MTNHNSLLIEAKGIAKAYHEGGELVGVLKSVDVSLAAGESVSIRGESGSGKTTLLNILAGLEKADKGELFWEGQPVGEGSLRHLAKKRRQFMGLVFQSYHLMPELTALENVLFARRMIGSIDEVSKKQAQTLLERTGLSHRLRHLPSQLSGGERQRVAIARALMNSPQVLLADEPTGNLDEKTAENVFNLLMDLTREHKVGLLLVTHSLVFAQRTDRQVALHLGEVSR